MKRHLALALSCLACILAFILPCIATTPARAAVPGEVSYQGLLLDDGGAPLTASVTLDFDLFAAPTGGTALWTENHSNVQVVDGVYDVRLGSTNPLTPALVAGGTLYLEITVDGETLSPRQPLLVVPYALRSAVAEDAEQLGGLSAGYLTQILEHVNFDGGPPSNLDPREGLADPDGDGRANFVDPDNDNDGLSDSVEIGQGSDINLVTPTLSGFDPPTADGFETTSIQVHGTNFGSGMTVAFGSQNPTPTNVTPTSFDVQVGPQPEGTVNVSVTLTDGESAVTTFPFFYRVPSIDSFSPSRLDPGQSGMVTVMGQNFIAGMTVAFGSQSPTPTNITPTSFDISVEPEPVGLVSVTVTLPNGKSATNDTGLHFGSDRVIFVTSARYSGNLGGLAGADAICQSVADGAGLSGTFHAWLSDSTDSPSTRESQAGSPYVRTDMVTVAGDWADLTDGSLASPISRDENGALVSQQPDTYVWTDVAAVGAGPESSNNCSDWTSAGSIGGRRGSFVATDGTWTQVGTGSGCSATLHLYCVEQ